VWPLALGLVAPETGKIASFVAMLIRQGNVASKFVLVLNTILLLARDDKYAGDKLSSAITALVCRDISLPAFLLICFQSIYFEPSPFSHSPALLALMAESPFGVETAPKLGPIGTVADLMTCDVKPVLSTFSLRLNETHQWIDRLLVDSLVSSSHPKAQSLQHYAEVTAVFTQRARMPFEDLVRCVEALKETVAPTDLATLAAAFAERLARAEALLSGAAEPFADNWEAELRKADDLATQAHRIRRQIRKEIVHQRDSALFFREERPFVLARDRTRCAAFCPVKLKPKFDADKKGFWPWEVLEGSSVQAGESGAQSVAPELQDAYECRLIRPKGSVRAQLWFSPTEIGIGFPDSAKTFYVRFKDVRAIFPRRQYQRETAIEILLRDGGSFLLDFAPIENKDILPLFAAIEFTQLSLGDITKQWVASTISNFAYIMYLNTLAGRSFDDLAQYPLFPNLRDRDLSKPASDPPIGEAELEQFLYESLLPPSVVDSVLARFEPFTSIHVVNQHGVFDVLSTFDEIAHCEFPADFFFQPELFSDVNRLALPPFALDCRPFQFVYELRQLLEHPRVSAHLHEWADLVFGVHQQGPGAAALGNLFHPCILDSVWGSDAGRTDARVCPLMRVYGAMPARLFAAPHPPRAPRFLPSPEFAHRSFEVAPLILAAKARARELWLLDVTGKLLICAFDLAITCTATRDLPVSPSASFAVLGDRVLCYDGGRFTAHAPAPAGECDLPAVDRFDGSGTKFATLRNATVLSLFDVEGFAPAGRAVITEDAVACFALSEAFHALVVATRDGLLRFYALADRRLRALARMPAGTARRVAVSEAWGFAIVDLGAEFAVFSINGEPLAHYRHDCAVACWSAVASRSDFDFVVLADIRGNLVAFEACRPARRTRITRLTVAVCAIEYERGADALAVVSAGGSVMIVARPFGAFGNSA
jgi:hypothetical protein